MDILLADDHKQTREQLRALLEGEADLHVAGEAGSAEVAVELVSQVKPDVIVMDIVLPIMGGIEATRSITKEHPDTRILGLSNHANPAFAAALVRSGGSGYVLKEHAFDELIDAVRTVHSGQTYFGKDVQAPKVNGDASGRRPGRGT